MSTLLVGLVVVIVVGVSGDNTGCPGVFEGNGDWCYALLHVKASWAESQRYCEEVGGRLAVINDDAENTFIKSMLTRRKSSIQTAQIWFGGTDLLQEGTFVSPKDLDQLTYFNWAPGEPDNLNGQHCLALFNHAPDYLWDDATCENLYNPLCKRAKSLDNSGIIG